MSQRGSFNQRDSLRDRIRRNAANTTGPSQRGAFYQHPTAGSPYGNPPEGYVNPPPALYPGHIWVPVFGPPPGEVKNADFPVLPSATNQQPVPAENNKQTWASQFGLQNIEPVLQDVAAWLTPRCPSLEPCNTGSISHSSENSSAHPKPSARDLDTLFMSEAIQRNRFAGLTTAEAQLFALQPAVLEDDDAEHECWFKRAFGEHIIDSGSDSWLSIFRPERWNMIHRNTGAGTPVLLWSWGDATTGKALKPSVVLADAILKSGLQGRWLQTLLQTSQERPLTENVKRKDGTSQRMSYLPRRSSQEWIENPLADFRKTQRINEEFDAEDVEFGVDIVEKEWQGKEDQKPPGFKPYWQKKGEEVVAAWETEAFHALNFLANGVIWTFYDPESDPGNADGDGGRATFHVETIHRKNEASVMESVYIIALSTEMFVPLFDGNASPMEKALATHTAAIVMLRGIITVISKWKCATFNVTNLAISGEKIADLVSSFENDTFGGKLDFPFRHDRAGDQRNGRSLLITGSDWPNAGDWVRDHFRKSEGWMDTLRMMGTCQPYSIRTQWFSYPIPSAWSVNMLKAGFWNTSFENGFTLKFPKHFKALTQRCPQTWGATHLESKTFPVQTPEAEPRSALPDSKSDSDRVKAPQPLDLLVDECSKIGDRLRARREKWIELRKDWYSSALLAWELTPYSMPQSRWMLAQLKYWMRNQTPRSEFLAHELLFQFWLAEKPSANAGPLGWFYAAVGHMFAACLPSRSEAKTYGPIDDPHSDVVNWAALKDEGHTRGFNVHDIDEVLRATIATPGFTIKARYGGLDERKRHLRLARRMGEIYFFTRPHARMLRKTFMASLRNLEHQAREETDAANWWICQFALPPYSADLEGVNEDHSANTAALEEQPDVEVGKTGLMIKPQAFHQFATTMAQARKDSLPLKLDKWNTDTIADESYLQIQGDDHLTRYWTVGNIADKVSEGKRWVVERQGDGQFTVIDIARAIREENKSPESVDSVLVKGPYGFQPKGGSLRHHFDKASWELFDKVGYVLPAVHQEMVDSNNGTNDNKPFWISVGADVFDITDFPWYEFGGEELATRLRKQFSQLTHSFLEEGGDLFNMYPSILERLMPYRCAKLLPNPISQATSENLRMFLTREEIRWHEFPETGMYVIIEGNVYDVSEYCEVHPGGQALLCRYGGQDITTIFHQTHRNSHELLQTPLFQSMLVGRIIPTRSYDLPLRVGEEEHSGYMWSKRPEDLYADGTQHCIAKKLKRAGPLVRMTPEELMLCDGDDGEDWFNEAWCAVKDMVYNMTSVVRYSKEPWVDALKPFLGGTVTDEHIAMHVMQKYRFRAVALLMEEKTEDDYIFHKRKRGDEPRQYARKLQQRDRMLFNDPPADVYLDKDRNPNSNIPDHDSLLQKYPFRIPKRRRPPAPYNDYNTPLDKDTFLKHASGKYYGMLRDHAGRRADKELARRDKAGRRVEWNDTGKFLIENLDKDGSEVHEMHDLMRMDIQDDGKGE